MTSDLMVGPVSVSDKKQQIPPLATSVFCFASIAVTVDFPGLESALSNV
jgi:hypothetical protein